MYDRLWVFHGSLPLKLTLVHFWGNNSSGLEKELKSEKEQRQALQRELQRERDTTCLLQTELQQVEGLKKVRQRRVGTALHLLQNSLRRPVSPVPLCGRRGLEHCAHPHRASVLRGDGEWSQQMGLTVRAKCREELGRADREEEARESQATSHERGRGAGFTSGLKTSYCVETWCWAPV